MGRLKDPRLVKWGIWAVIYGSMLYLTLMVILRWIVSGYVPLSNGFETMQALAWIVLLLTILAGRKPVSYTHLDVYKRQVSTSSGGMTTTTPCFK